MRIALTADPEIPIPPALYGGIERMIHGLAEGLVARGHDVTLFAHPDSRVAGRLAPYPSVRNQTPGDVARNTWHVSSSILARGFDVVHSWGRLAYVGPLLAAGVPVLMSYQRPVTASRVRWAAKLSRNRIGFAAVSRHHLAASPTDHGRWFVVYNGVSEEAYRFQPRVVDDAPLVFLGRMEHIKGPHLAIETARRTGRRLVLAGNIPDAPEHRQFFDAQVRPHIDGERIRYVGPVDDRAKNELLGSGLAFLMPVLWDELFGIVMGEALACGLPVIGLNRGAVPEIVQPGVNGFVCDSVDEMVTAVGRVHAIDRRDCRRILEERFSERVMITAYEEIYGQIAHRGSPARVAVSS